MVFRTIQTQNGAGDWDLTTGAKELTPNKDERLIYALIAFFGYALTIFTFLLAKFKYPKLYNLISTMMVLNMAIY
jgi:hypothetical protein